MAIRNHLLIILVHLFLSPVVFSSYIPPNIKLWCRQTPYPQHCEYFMNHKHHSSGVKSRSDFKKLAVRIALEQALMATSNAMLLGPKCRNEREKVAWADCLELYDNTIIRLNDTINSNYDDYMTWLSTALTNLETCRTGFVELGITDYILPLMPNNVSELISNTLAVSKLPTGEPATYEDGSWRPSWVKADDQKLLQTASRPTSEADVVVAQDGTGDFETVNEAMNAAAKQKRRGRLLIYVKAGTYRENVQIGKKLKNIMLIGDGMGKTIITGSKSVRGGSTTFSSATVAVSGDGFIARDITFQNTAGPENGQAVALRSGSDLSVFYRCGFEGYQDTLYVHSERQFYRECDIYGTVDFIFGNAAVVFQKCNIYARRHSIITVTAQGRNDPNQNSGIVIHNSRVMAASDLKPVQSSVKAYLGRPWRQYSRTVYLKTFLDSLIHPGGWLEWNENSALNKLYYGEYQNTGPGSSTANRVKWGGYHIITTLSEASTFTVENFLAGDSWLPVTGVPFTSGL
ncbi:PREDICTED: pectinesterase 2-like [Nelumbo nucifera]|uniref:Pectinesterase n=2 Tax=Nelumbo nucifera TaxID=4432 RepID=A0A1U7ZXF2_NELNU|nr:PREDICTED: pectinesterase 2-like [Nelumbo nucifera]DAD47861.1 TPA_asm: hypothetical protein HUJ06_017798 [Nelumbo nucifera]